MDPKEKWDFHFINNAVKRLYKYDNHLIVKGQELSATARIACHLRDVLSESGYLNEFKDIRVDVEYRREGDAPKRDTSGKLVRPDIIVHVPRSNIHNIAVIEAKGWWNSDDGQDIKKLKSFIKKQEYSFACFLIIGEKYESCRFICMPCSC